MDEDRKIKDLRRRLREANRLLQQKEEQLARAEMKQDSGGTDKLIGWLDDLDAGVSVVLGSRRWKIGNFIGDLGGGSIPGRREPEVEASIRGTLGQFRAWKKRRTRRHAPSQRAGPAQAPSVKPASGRLGPEHEDGIKRVQVGCGPHNIMDDWWNVDILAFPGVDAVVDVTYSWPYEDLEYVYGEHFLEHLTLDGAIRFLQHAGNSLKAGGILRLSTPNLEWVLHTHYAHEGAGSEEVVSGTMRMNRAFHGWGHQFLYSEGMLEHVLTQMGFEGVSFFSYGESSTPALRDLERHGKFSVSGGHPSVVIAEATRGERPIEPSQELSSRIQSNYLNVVHDKAH